MEMEFMTEFTSRDRARGKRTKRPKLRLPVSDCLIDNFAHDQLSSSEEDEDTANCLIMLAQSVCGSPINEEYSNSNSKSDHQIRQKTEKLSNLRGVYECKTCNRTFPSFQALGGHRASHKKPKLNVEEKKSNSVPIEDDHREEEEEKLVEEDKENMIMINDQKSTKVHECSVCGSEFLSGQALGGHMRKHRPIPPSINRNSMNINLDNDHNIMADDVIEKSRNMLSLDLNFPPPEIVEDVKSKFQFTSQQRLVFPSPALVDCHY